VILIGPFITAVILQLVHTVDALPLNQMLTFTENIMYTLLTRVALVLLIGHRTCDLQVVGLSHGWAPLHSGLGQATYTCVPGKVTTGMVESNASPPLDLRLMSPAG